MDRVKTFTNKIPLSAHNSIAPSFAFLQGSAPEFFTSLMAVTVSKNDVGFGTIVGSAVFNVLFVIGVCGVFANETLQLTWWPLFRDCNYYIFSLLILSYFIRDNYVSFTEALGLFILYIGYVTVMKYNEQCKSVVSNIVPWSDKPSPGDESAVSEAGKVFQRAERGANNVGKLALNNATDGASTPVKRRRRRSLTPLMTEVRKAKANGGALPTSLIQDLELLSTSFKFHSRRRNKISAVNGGTGTGSEAGALGKFKVGAMKVIENKKLADHAEMVLSK